MTFFCFCDQHWWNRWDPQQVASSGGPGRASHVSEHMGPGDLPRSRGPSPPGLPSGCRNSWGPLPLPFRPSQKLGIQLFSELTFLSLGQRPLLRPYKSEAGKKLLLPGSLATLSLQDHPTPHPPTIPLASTFPPQAFRESKPLTVFL